VSPWRLSDRSIAGVRAIGLGAVTLALLTQVAAQDNALRTRLRAAPDRTQLQSADRDGMRGSVGPGQPIGQLQPRSSQRTQAQPRRSRPPTAAPTRAPTQLPTVLPNVAREVDAAVTGLPEPPAPPVARKKRPVETDPYAPLGLRLGGVTVWPRIEQSAGYDTNPNRSSGLGKQGSRLLRTEGEARLQSDWLFHELTGYLRGGYSAYPDVDGADRPDGEGRVNLRLDAARDTQIDLESRFRLDTERPGSPDLTAAVRDRPLILAAGGAAGVTQRFNRLLVGLRGALDRTEYEDATLANGAILDQSDRNTTQYGARLRAGYEIHPGFIPFVEGLADTRVHDEAIDRSGFRRDSDGVGVRAGSTFEITRKLTGEVSAGLQARRYDDPRLRDLRGPVADAALVWSATPLTTVKLRGQSEIEETTIPFSSGALTQKASLEVQHDLRRNLSVIAAVGLSETDYKGVFLKEDIVTGSLKVDYRLTRSIALRAGFTHERLKSTAPGSDYTANVVLLGLRFQP
jgi:hypothetical protein